MLLSAAKGMLTLYPILYWLKDLFLGKVKDATPLPESNRISMRLVVKSCAITRPLTNGFFTLQLLLLD
jgi:hypothetical protein